MKIGKENMVLYAVTDRAWVGEKTLYEQVEDALKGGITCLQLREKNLSPDEFLKEAIAIRELCSKYNVPFIINDNVDIAVKCKADGVHVGQDDMKAEDVRRIAGRDFIIGVSAHSIEEALDAVKGGADYLGVGAMHTTATKTNVTAMTYEVLKSICASVSIPVVAIGGINKDNIDELKGSGVSGVAVVSAVFGAKDIEEECKELKSICTNMIKG